MKLIFISGWAHGPDAMAPLAELLGERVSAQCVALHEFLASPPSMSEPTVLVGWSTGAIAALQAAVAAADEAVGVVTIGGTARFCACDGYPSGVPAANLRAMAIGLRRRPEATLKRFFADSAQPAALADDVLAAKVGYACDEIGMGTLAAGLSFLGGADVRSDLSRIGVPVLALHGSEDKIIPVSASEHLTVTIADARLAVLPGVGHAIPEQAPDSAAAEIASWLSRDVVRVGPSRGDNTP